MSAWVWGGVAMVTASTSSRPRASSTDVRATGMPNIRARSAVLAGSRPTSAGHLEAGCLQGAHMGETAEPGADHDHTAHRAPPSTARVASAAALAASPAGRACSTSENTSTPMGAVVPE